MIYEFCSIKTEFSFQFKKFIDLFLLKTFGMCVLLNKYYCKHLLFSNNQSFKINGKFWPGLLDILTLIIRHGLPSNLKFSLKIRSRLDRTAVNSEQEPVSRTRPKTCRKLCTKTCHRTNFKTILRHVIGLILRPS